MRYRSHARFNVVDKGIRRSAARILCTVGGASLLVSGIAAAATAVPAAAKSTVTGAQATTVDVSVDGSPHCFNGSGIPNCNIYDGKQYVWFSGLPDTASLGAGTYIWAVLSPGGQYNPNDLAPLRKNGEDPNLSDETDPASNREFSTDGSGTNVYNGTHDTDGNLIRVGLSPAASPPQGTGVDWYGDTPNPGGVYILAVCQISPNQTAKGDLPIPVSLVDPSLCKFDAFKVQVTVCTSNCGEPPSVAPDISKDGDGTYSNICKWSITKDVDKATATLRGGGSATFNYIVTVTRDDCSSVDNKTIRLTGGVFSDGTDGITVLDENLDGLGTLVPLQITSVTDTLHYYTYDVNNNIATDFATVCTVTNGGPQTLLSVATTFPYECDPSRLPTNGETAMNVATVTWPYQEFGSVLTPLAAGSQSFDLPSDEWSPPGFNSTGNEDNCVVVTDPLDPNSPELQTCTSPTTYNYSRTVNFNQNLVPTCVKFDNTATFTTNTTGTTGSDKKTVTVCFYNPALTIGYWSQHLAPTTANSLCPSITLASNRGGSSNGPWTCQYLPQYLGTYSVSSYSKANSVFLANNCSNATTSSQNAIGCLAAQLLGAELNVANGAQPCSTIALANTFLATMTYTIKGITYTGYVGPTGNYSGISASERTTALALQTSLTNYNQGGTC
jgi:hypothetical protein